MKVFFLGAGASMAACYPLAKDLFPALERECGLPSAETSIVHSWERFQRFKEKAGDSAVGPILRSGNPEIVLSLLDLLCAASEFETTDYFAKIKSGHAAGHVFLRDTPEYTEAQQAIRGLIVCLEHYFGRRHYLDLESPDKREYLKKELAPLTDDDVVITTNWDSLTERVLLEQGLWSPSDGFGFPIRFRSLRAGSALGVAETSSRVKVLKLHGSFGWRTKRTRLYPEEVRIYLRNAGYLQHMTQLFYLQDIEEPHPPGVNDDPLLIYPTFFKRFDSPDLAVIWSAAQEALSAATEVHVVGYSLPASDTPVRTLLNCLRGRLKRCEVDVVVDEPSCEAGQRWRDFLPGCQVRKRGWGVKQESQFSEYGAGQPGAALDG